MINVEKLKPSGIFTNYIYKTIPLAFDESMSYYETLCGLLSYLKDTVIPTVDNNADALIELQNYVEHYFDNLDVQEEINNKLDEMAESGQLTEIIAQYLQLSGILAYNTVNDMKNAVNIVDGSFAKTYGKLTYDDGKGSFYKIREIKNTDVVDEVNIIAIINDVNLVAEKITDYYLNQEIINRTNSDTNLQNQIDINSADKYIFIGDSYLYGQGLSNPTTENYGYLLKDKLNLNDNDYFIFSEPGSGFNNKGNNDHNFLELLQASESIITNKNLIKNIIVCGGANDGNYTPQNIQNNITSFVNYCKTNYPNAKVYIGMISNSNATTNGTRANIKGQVYNAYKRCNECGATYLNGIEMAMQNYIDNYQSDNVHPNANGQIAIANALYQAITSGSNETYSPLSAKVLTKSDAMSESTMYFNERIKNDRINVIMNGGVTLNSNITSPITFGANQCKYIRNTQNIKRICNARIADINFTQVQPCIVEIGINTDGFVTISIPLMPNVSNPRILIIGNQTLNFDYDEV